MNTNQENQIRNAARAVILRDTDILLLRKHDEKGERFALPGGGQQPGETLRQALVRECEEEIGCIVSLRDLLHVADYFKPRKTVPPSIRQLVEFLFLCEVPEDYRPRNGHRPDKHQVEVIWYPQKNLADIPLPPQSLAQYLNRTRTPNIYLGTLD